MKPKVFVTRPLPYAALERLEAACDLQTYPEDAPIPKERLAESCREIDGLLSVGARITEELIRQAPRLRAIATPSVGVDHIDVAACTARKIPIANTVGVVEETTADLAFALLLAAARRVLEADAFVRAGGWKHWKWNLMRGANAHHKTLGLIGFGRIGQAVARRGRGFGMRILYSARHHAPEAVEKELMAEFRSRDELLAESDFVSLHVPLTPETWRMIGARDLSRMKPTAFLINTARGAVVDEAALVEALQGGRIAGAGLDVFEREPAVSAELLQMPNVVLMPHVGSATDETRFEMAKVAADSLLDLLDGRRPPSVVNPEVFPGHRDTR